MGDPVLRILVVQLRQLGDILCDVPLFRAIKKAYPDCRLTLLVERACQRLVPLLPFLDDAIVIERQLTPGRALDVRRRLCEERFDLVIDAQSSHKTALYTRLTAATRRVGFKQPWHRFWANRWYTDVVERRFGDVYAVDYRLDLLRHVGMEPDGIELDVQVPDEARAKAEAFFADRKLPVGETVALAPFPRRLNGQWGLEKYEALGRHLVEGGWRVLIIAGPGERDKGRELAARIGEAVVEEDDSFGMHVGILACCGLLVGDEGGNVHFCAALRVPTITFYGPIPPGSWAPPNVERHRRIVGPCVYEPRPGKCRCKPIVPCLQGIGVDSVTPVVDEVLSKIGRPR